jgi:3-phenylpropionate/trans-cinnamate dioxygenase ferredoxin component
MSVLKRVAGTSDVPLGDMKQFEFGHARIVIAHTADGFFAVADECTHDSAPISDGEIDGCEVVCMRHGARFDLKTGAVTGPPAIVPVDTYEVVIDGDDILVRLND